MDVGALPDQFWWGNASGANAITTARNQHIPQYCGSCWAMATTSALSDRLKIAAGPGHAEINLAPQVLINCDGGGTCFGGDPSKAYHYMSENGVPEETCQNYEAVNGECKPMGVCETCWPGDTPDTFLPGKCVAVANFSRWFVDEYGMVNAGRDTDVTGHKLRSADKIKAEIFARGPVSCGMHVSKQFVDYRGGIFKQFTPAAWLLDHEISLIGWGEENGEEFWVGRNSWGTWWGEQGLFRIAMHHFNLGIELECTWATPSLAPSSPGEHVEEKETAVMPGWMLAKGWESGGKVPRGGKVPHSGKVQRAPGASLVGGTYSVHPSVKKGSFHNYDEPCLRRPKAAQERGKRRASGIQEPIDDTADLTDLKRDLREVSMLAQVASRQQASKSPIRTPFLPRLLACMYSGTKSVSVQDYKDADELGKYPKSWDVRNVGGINYATLDKNQHIPTYCGSCWAQSVTSALSDRINMRRNNSFPKTVVAAQALVNCVSANETKGCRGGDPTAANSWMQV